jgi:hypothetical protein
VCHQTVCLIAQELERNGTPTLVLGAALDIMQAGRPPRGVFLDYPLGHSSGRPDDPADQYAIVRAAVTAFDTIREPGTILRLPNRWGADEAWKQSAGASSGGDTRQPRDTTPQYQFAEDRQAAESAAAKE